MSNKQEIKKISAWKSFTAGGAGGICAVVSGHPLDLVKVRLQTMPVPKPNQNPQFAGAFDCFKQTLQKEGFRGLYKGMGAPLVGIAPIFAISFWGFGVGKNQILAYHDNPNHKMTLTENFAAGAFSGIFTTVIMAPGERVKCLLQIQQDGGKKLYNGPVDCIKKLYAEGGIKSIYRGTLLTLFRDVPASGAYFAGYEGIKQLMTPKGQDTSQLSIASVLVAGGTAGCLNWGLAIIPDGVKSRFQTAPTGKYNGMKDVIVDILKNEGFRGMYRGFAPVMLRAFPANACCFLGYEGAMKFLNYVSP